MTLQRGVEVEFLAHHAAIADRLQRQAFQRLEHALGFATAVRLDVADHDVGPGRLGRERRLEHRVGLADPGRGTEEDTQPPAARPRFLGLHLCEQLVRVRAVVGHPSIIGRCVEREVQLEHVHARLTQDAQRSSLGGGPDQCEHLRFGQPALASDARHLEFGRGDGDLRVEAAA